MSPTARRSRPALAGLLLLLGLWLAGLGAGARAAEPFYVELLEAGTRHYLRGDYPAAAKSLRVACFGLLDDPPLLTRGLVRLALAQAGAGDEAGFAATFDRLVEVEASFGTYSAQPSETPFRIELERLLPQRFTISRLEAIPAFADVAARMREARLTALPPKRLRKELQRRLAADPEDDEALILITRLDIAQNRGDKAQQRLVARLTAAPDHRMARCLLGQIELRRDDCAAAMENLSSCSRPPADEILGARYLRCLVAAEDWPAAGGYLASMPLDLRNREEVANLILAIPAEALADAARAPGESETELATPGAAAAAPAATTERAPAAIEDLRRDLAAAGGREELEGLFTRLAEQANGRRDEPELQYLAAEAAYRRADHPTAVRFFRRGGLPGDDRPLLRFYFAVALFETGATEEAAEVLRSAVPRLERTAFVERYRELILGSAASD